MTKFFTNGQTAATCFRIPNAAERTYLERNKLPPDESVALFINYPLRDNSGKNNLSPNFFHFNYLPN